MTGNYELVYYVAENVGILGILAYPKIYKETDAISYRRKDIQVVVKFDFSAPIY